MRATISFGPNVHLLGDCLVLLSRSYVVFTFFASLLPSCILFFEWSLVKKFSFLFFSLLFCGGWTSILGDTEVVSRNGTLIWGNVIPVGVADAGYPLLLVRIAFFFFELRLRRYMVILYTRSIIVLLKLCERNNHIFSSLLFWLVYSCYRILIHPWSHMFWELACISFLEVIFSHCFSFFLLFFLDVNSRFCTDLPTILFSFSRSYFIWLNTPISRIILAMLWIFISIGCSWYLGSRYSSCGSGYGKQSVCRSLRVCLWIHCSF